MDAIGRSSKSTAGTNRSGLIDPFNLEDSPDDMNVCGPGGPDKLSVIMHLMNVTQMLMIFGILAAILHGIKGDLCRVWILTVEVFFFFFFFFLFQLCFPLCTSERERERDRREE